MMSPEPGLAIGLGCGADVVACARRIDCRITGQHLNRQPVNRTFKVELICIVDAIDHGTPVFRTEQRNLMLPSSRLFHWLKRGFEWNYLRRYR